MQYRSLKSLFVEVIGLRICSIISPREVFLRYLLPSRGLLHRGGGTALASLINKNMKNVHCINLPHTKVLILMFVLFMGCHRERMLRNRFHMAHHLKNTRGMVYCTRLVTIATVLKYVRAAQRTDKPIIHL